MLLLAVDVENHLMFYKIRTIFNPIQWLLPINICIIIICMGMLFTKHVYSANGQEVQAVQCLSLNEKANLITKLEEEMGEVSIFVGLSAKDIHTIEIFINSKTGSWTVVGTNLEKVCILDFGIQGQVKKLKELGQGV
jgi:hypothetical protein